MFDWLFGWKRLAVPGLRKLSGRKSANASPAAFEMPALPFSVETVNGTRALQTVDRMRAEGNSYPVILGGDRALQSLSELLASENLSGDMESISRQAEDNPFPHAWREHVRREREKFGEHGLLDPDFISGNWPAQVEPQTLFSHLDRAGGLPGDRVHIGLLPLNDPTLVPAFLQFGGWNECPDAVTHVAAARHWQRQWGAEIVAVAGDVLEYRVRSRPETREQALKLAEEQCLFCPDIVAQGTGSIENLAAILMISDWWFFWWD